MKLLKITRNNENILWQKHEVGRAVCVYYELRVTYAVRPTVIS